MRLPSPLLLGLALVGGCAEQANSRYPSLLPRPIEQRSDAEPVAPPPAPATADTALDTHIAALQKSLTDNNAAFAATALRAEREANAAKGQPPGSDRWITAQTTLAELDELRANTSSIVTDVESVAMTRAADGQPDYPALQAIQTSSNAALTDQNARIAAIQAIPAP